MVLLVQPVKDTTTSSVLLFVRHQHSAQWDSSLAYKLHYFCAAFGAVDTRYFIPAHNAQEGVGAWSASESRIEIALLMRTVKQGLGVTHLCNAAFCL